MVAVISSFVLRNELPASGKTSQVQPAQETSEVTAETTLLSDVNYPFFRGEGSRGIAGGTDYPTQWNGTDGTNIKWKTVVPKPGKNSPVIWGDKLFITGAVKGDCEVYCINKKTGEDLMDRFRFSIPGSFFRSA